MSDQVLLRVENVSKKFCRSLKRSMLYGVEDIARDAINVKPKTEILRKDEFWAVNDISFEIKRGECLGIIGPNGAGKSTLLKMLNGIILPDKGEITVQGKIGALIEVGAGFHPMLTGRENVYLNGAILGMDRKEIEAKFDKIVAFAELEEFIDMPVKHYSSGMYVRLGFAIAAELKPDILIIDEVLAVGDMGFRWKCYNNLATLLDSLAIIFVSHNMESITRLTNKVLVLNHGVRTFYGNPLEGSVQYLQLFNLKKNKFCLDKHALESVVVKNHENTSTDTICYGQDFSVSLKVFVPKSYPDINLKINFSATTGEIVAEYNNINDQKKISLKEGLNEISICIHSLQLLPQKYYLSTSLINNKVEHIVWARYIKEITVIGKIQGHQHYQLRSVEQSSLPNDTQN